MHADLANIAGDMTVQLLVGGEASRADWQERDPLSLEIHDRFVAAASAGVVAYKAFVEGDGTRLLERRRDAVLAAPR